MPRRKAMPIRSAFSRLANRLHTTDASSNAPLAAGQTVLEAAEEVGVPIEYACRQGYCGLCKIKLLSGEVTMDVDDGLTPLDRSSGVILACQAKASADISVDA